MNANDLARQVAELTHDVDAQRRVIERVTDERDFYRTAYEKQCAKLDRLTIVINALEEIRHGNP